MSDAPYVDEMERANTAFLASGEPSFCVFICRLITRAEKAEAELLKSQTISQELYTGVLRNHRDHERQHDEEFIAALTQERDALAAALDQAGMELMEAAAIIAANFPQSGPIFYAAGEKARRAAQSPAGQKKDAQA